MVNQKEIFVDSEFKIFPNPSNVFVFLQNESEYKTLEVELINTDRKILEKIKMNELSLKIDVQRLPVGIYFFKIINPKNRKVVEVLKFQKIGG